MKTTAWMAILASAAPALAMPGLSGFAGTKRGSWKNTTPAQYINTPRSDDTPSLDPMSSSSLSEPASNPPTTESNWGHRFIAALQMLSHKDSISYAPAASAESSPQPEVAPATVVSVITEYASATPTAVTHLDEKTVTIFETVYEAVCTKTDVWTLDGTPQSSVYETTTTTTVDFHNPNSPSAAPETISSHSVLTPVLPFGPFHPSGDSIVTSTSVSVFETTATETNYHTVEPSPGFEPPSAPVGEAGGDPPPSPTTSSRSHPTNYGNIPLTHSTKSSPPTSVASSPSAEEHEPTWKASSAVPMESHGPTSAMPHGEPSSLEAPPVHYQPSSHESPAAFQAPSSPVESEWSGPVDTPSYSQPPSNGESALPASPSFAFTSAPEAAPTSSFEQPPAPVPIPETESQASFPAPVDTAPVDSAPVPTTWVEGHVSQFTSVYATAVPTTSSWTIKNSNITRSSTFFVNSTMTSTWSSTVSQTHSSKVLHGDNSTVTHTPGPLGGNQNITHPTPTGGHFGSQTSCTAKPTQTDFCIPCEGQPGNDPDSFCGYTINDDYYEVMPKTCRTREYFFEVSSVMVAPDGVERMAMVVNGQMPGPLIEANWGDTIIVHLENKLQDNGTSVHFHGMRQLNNNEMDGVPSITQCALAPGEKMTYTFEASSYGFTWWHSHFALQAYEGVFGPMLIHGPSSAEYDVDAGHIVLQDWSHQTVDSQYHNAETVGPSPEFGPRTLDTGLINGMNVWTPDNGTTYTGSRYEMTLQPGKTHLMHVVNTAIQSTFKFHIDGHKFTVIAADFIPIEPYETDILNINIGQRYAILVQADQEPGDYWMRSDNQQACAQLHNPRDIKGIVHYAGFTGTPETTSRNYTDECVDEPYEKLVPVVPAYAGPQTSEIHKNVLVGEGPNTPNLFKWTLDGNTFQSQWGDPTLGGIYWNDTVPSYSGNLAIEVPQLEQWVYVIVESPVALPHPIHLHGHDSLVLAQGTGPYSDDVQLKLDNPPRRDTALMPFNPETGEGGYVVIGFKTDNPGAWLMHCHIGWHVSMGFALQIIEAKDQIKETVKDSCQLEGTCKSWNQYAEANHVYTDDSGV